MKLIQYPKMSTLLFIALSAFVFGANTMQAQVSRGEFTLPVQAHWGSMVMAPGPYSYILERVTSGFIISVRPPNKSSLLRIPITGAVSLDPLSETSRLLLESQDGETTVRSIYFGRLGVTLHYPPSKSGAHLIKQGGLKKDAEVSGLGE